MLTRRTASLSQRLSKAIIANNSRPANPTMAWPTKPAKRHGVRRVQREYMKLAALIFMALGVLSAIACTDAGHAYAYSYTYTNAGH